jgi:hypothetical protein
MIVRLINNADTVSNAQSIWLPIRWKNIFNDAQVMIRKESVVA